jgi:hypothetical protein
VRFVEEVEDIFLSINLLTRLMVDIRRRRRAHGYGWRGRKGRSGEEGTQAQHTRLLAWHVIAEETRGFSIFRMQRFFSYFKQIIN